MRGLDQLRPSSAIPRGIADPHTQESDSAGGLEHYVEAVEVIQAWRWIADGWRLFNRDPQTWMMATFIWLWLEIGLALLLPYLGLMIGTLVLPMLYAGFLHGARELDQGGEFSIGHVFRGFTRASRILPLLFLGLLPLSFEITLVIFGAFLGTVLPGLMAVAPLGIMAFVALLYSCPLVMFVGIRPIPAIHSSYEACAKNLAPLLVIVVFLMLLAVASVITLGLGLLVAMPLSCCALHLSYMSIYGQSEWVR